MHEKWPGPSFMVGMYHVGPSTSQGKTHRPYSAMCPPLGETLLLCWVSSMSSLGTVSKRQHSGKYRCAGHGLHIESSPRSVHDKTTCLANPKPFPCGVAIRPHPGCLLTRVNTRGPPALSRTKLWVQHWAFFVSGMTRGSTKWPRCLLLHGPPKI